MRKQIFNELKIMALGAAMGAAVLGSMLFFGMRAKAASVRDGVHPPVYAALQTIDRGELADMRRADEWSAPWTCPISQDELDLFAALVWSEAGDQPIPDGMCYVADVVLNRIDHGWGNSVSEVIYSPGQFSVVSNGALSRAYGNAPQVAYDAVLSQLQNRWNYDIIYFSMGYNANGTVAFTHGTHFYSY